MFQTTMPYTFSWVIVRVKEIYMKYIDKSIGNAQEQNKTKYETYESMKHNA